MPKESPGLILDDGDESLKIGSLVKSLGVSAREARTGVVVEIREHDHNVDHPWFGNSVVVLWSNGELSSGISARSLKIIAVAP